MAHSGDTVLGPPVCGSLHLPFQGSQWPMENPAPDD